MLTNFEAKINRLAGSGKPFFFMIDFDIEQPQVYPLDELPPDICIVVPGFANVENRNPESLNFRLEAMPPAFDKYHDAFKKVMAGINHGNSYLLNLTFKSELITSLTLEDIFQMSRARYKLMVKDRFVVFSPETFVRIRNGKISSFPMKGTIDAGLPGAAGRLLNDPKESAEHNTIVDLIRNDLAMVSEYVQVEQFKYLETVHTHKGDLLQMSSVVSGRLPKNYLSQLGNILMKLLPAGSISGAPKSSTLQIIREAEDYRRGFYTGIFGVFDGENLESAVMIRFIEKEGKRLFFKSGGGITSMSDPRKEYEELIQKIYVPVA